MAKMSIVGLDDFEKRLQTLEAGIRGEAAEKILKAGGQVLVDSWKNTIVSKGHTVTWAMHDNVGMTGVKPGKNGPYLEVYPFGTNNHRITNAQKAFIISKGRKPTKKGTKGIKGDNFVKAAEDAARAQITEAMQNALNEVISGKD